MNLTAMNLNATKLKSIHTYLGLFLLLPFIGWILTGIVFLVKPGYADAYQRLEVKTYPIERNIMFTPHSDWLETRILKTAIGEHLLIRTSDGWQHLQLHNLQPFTPPAADVIKALINDAIAHKDEAHKAERYGEVNQLDISKPQAMSFTTSTDVEVTLNWSNLGLQQRGTDTRLIGTLYKIHYLQWFNHTQADLILGIVGLLSLFILVSIGLWVYFLRIRRR